MPLSRQLLDTLDTVVNLTGRDEKISVRRASALELGRERRRDPEVATGHDEKKSQQTHARS